MLILFIYISRLSSNQKFHFYKNKFFFNLIIILLLIFSLKNLQFYSTYNFDSINLININSLEENLELKISIKKIYNLPTNLIILLIINYLLLTLFIIIEIININIGPLRKNI